jgi:hypothetical protein
MRTPSWLIVLLLLVILGVGVYAYFTTPLPFGLSAVIRTPGGANVPANTPTSPGASATRAAAGQPLVMGSTTIVVQAVQRNQDLAAANRGPAGSFTVVQVELQNGGADPLTPQPTDFRLIDDRGREYAVDIEATRAANAAAKRRYVFESTVSPGSRVVTLLVFETPSDVGGLTLRARLGYGDVELAR